MNKKELVRSYIKKKRYFNLAGVIKETGLSNQVAKNYLYALKSEGVVFSAGRGVYSSVAQEFHPQEKSRVIEIRQLLKKQFPELDFLIWNTLYFQTLRYAAGIALIGFVGLTIYRAFFLCQHRLPNRLLISSLNREPK